MKKISGKIAGCLPTITTILTILFIVSPLNHSQHSTNSIAVASYVHQEPSECKAIERLMALPADYAHPEHMKKMYAEIFSLLGKCESNDKQKIVASRNQLLDMRNADLCISGGKFSIKSLDDLNAQHYQHAYDDASAGLAVIDECKSDEELTSVKGSLLSFRGLAKHHLSQGGWRTDLNQANALLVKCQTLPGLYGTRGGALCETQEQYNIRASTDWDMESR